MERRDMVRTALLLWCAAAWALAGPAWAQCLTKDDSSPATGEGAREALLKGQQEFGLDMLRTLVLGPGGSTVAPPPPPGPYPSYAKKVWFKRSEGDASAPAQNVFFSPYSTYYALLMTYFGAADGSTTANALRKALHMDDGEVKGDKLTAMQAFHLEKMFRTTVKAYSTMMPDPQNTTDDQKASQGLGYELSVSNRLYFDNKEEVRPCLQKMLENEIQRLDFENNPDAARNSINTWVEMETKGHIKDLIPNGGITTNTNLVVVNAAYFKGLWASQFSPERTVKEVFYESRSKQTLVDMMHQKGNFNHLVSERLGAQVLELPYTGETASLVILLPPFALPDGLERTVAQLNVDALREALAPGSALARPLEVSIPKFSIEQSIDLKPTLTHLGLGSLFDEEADFSDFIGEDDLTKKNTSNTSGRKPIALDAAIHRARVDIDETGTEAAAATALFSFRSSRPLEPTSFVANHPFVFLIYDRVAQNGPFCFCMNANNNTYWCLRTINATHNFLFCEFVTGLLTFYNLRIDPFELWNRIQTLTSAELASLKAQLEHMKRCKGPRDCSGQPGDGNAQHGPSIQPANTGATHYKKRKFNLDADPSAPSSVAIGQADLVAATKRKKLPKPWRNRKAWKKKQWRHGRQRRRRYRQ